MKLKSILVLIIAPVFILLKAQNYKALDQNFLVVPNEGKGIISLKIVHRENNEPMTLPKGCYEQKTEFTPLNYYTRFCIGEDQKMNGFFFATRRNFFNNNAPFSDGSKLKFDDSVVHSVEDYNEGGKMISSSTFEFSGNTVTQVVRNTKNEVMEEIERKNSAENSMISHTKYYPDGALKYTADYEKDFKKWYDENGMVFKRVRREPKFNNEIYTTTYHINGKIDSLYQGETLNAAKYLELYNDDGELFQRNIMSDDHDVLEWYQNGKIFHRRTDYNNAKEVIEHYDSGGHVIVKVITISEPYSVETYGLQNELLSKTTEYRKGNEIYRKTTDGKGKIIKDEKVDEDKVLLIGTDGGILEKMEKVVYPLPPPKKSK